MKWLLIILPLASCIGTIIDDDAHEKMHTVLNTMPSQFEQDVGREWSLKLTTHNQTMTIREAQQKIALLMSPQQDCFTRDEILEKKLPITIKKDSSSFLVSTKQRLVQGEIYGLYSHDDNTHKFCLNYVFRAHASPKLVSHDLGDNAIKNIHSNRRRMRLTFDQPLTGLAENAVHIVSVDTAKPHPRIAELIVDSQDEKSVWVTLDSKEGFLPNSRYKLIFSSGIVSDDIAIDVDDKKELEFVAVPPRIYVSSTYAHVYWPFKQHHRLEIFVKKPDGAQEIVVFAPREVSLDRSYKIGTGPPLIIDDLMPNTDYEYLLRAEDAHGQVAVARGNFITGTAHSIVLSELMIDPLGDHARGQSAGEYLEIANIGERSIVLNNLSLQIEDVATGRQSLCQLNSLKLGAQKAVLVVARNFDKSRYGLLDEANIFRLEQDTLCHGFSNRKPKMIRLVDRDGFVIDQYGGYWWPAKKGMAIARSATMGLADEHNYCYSEPTPGKQNSPCG